MSDQPSHAIATVGTVVQQDAAPVLPVVPVQRLAVDWQVLIPLIFAGVALLINTTISAWNSTRAKTIVRDSAKAGDVRETKLDHITVLVNGRYSGVLQELADVRRQFAGLSGRAEDRHQADLAQQRADAHARTLQPTPKDPT